jgi:hypothetical protein
VTAKKTIQDCIDLAKERGGLFLSEKYTKSQEKYIWQCKEGHTWSATHNHVFRGSWCPACNGNKKFTIDDCHAFAAKQGGIFLSDEYTNSTTPYLWQCESGHKWLAPTSRIARGHWCNECAVEKSRRTLKECQDLAISKNGECLSDKYINNISKLIWKCDNGHTWKASYSSVKSGSWCRQCYRHTVQDCVELAEKFNGKFLSKEFMGDSIKHSWMCENGHIWQSAPSTIRQAHWCAKCAGVNKNTVDDCHALAEKKEGEFISKHYIAAHSKYKWKCKKGHMWEASYSNIKQGRWCPICKIELSKRTFLRKYGVDNPSKNRDIALKTAKSLRNAYILNHWKTGEEVVCVASYEKKVVEYFNKNKIDFHWQPKVFQMPNGKTYRPDCYLPDQDLWIEVKGYFRKTSLDKWIWFQSVYINSELWNKKKLKEMNIL